MKKFTRVCETCQGTAYFCSACQGTGITHTAGTRHGDRAEKGRRWNLMVGLVLLGTALCLLYWMVR